MDLKAALFIKTSLLYFVSGISLGTYILIDKALTTPPLGLQYIPIHIQWLLTGFLIQMIVGVAHWILPKLDTPDIRGSAKVIYSAYGILNGGNLVVTASMLLHNSGFKWVGYALVLGGVILMAKHLWPRAYVLKDTKAFG